MTTVQAVHSYGQPFKHVIDFLLFPKCLLYRFSWFPIVLHLFYLPINLEPLGIIINLQSIIVIYKIYQSLILTASLVKFQSNCCLSKCRGSPTSTISTSTNFRAIGIERSLDHLLTRGCTRIYIHNGCFDAYEAKVNKDIYQYQEKVKLTSQFRRFLKFFNGLLEFPSFP